MNDDSIIIRSAKSYLKMAHESDTEYISIVRHNSSLYKMLSKFDDEIYNKPFLEVIKRKNLFWIMTYQHELCGYIELQNTDENDIKELGIELFKQYQDKGIGTESIIAFTDNMNQQRGIQNLKLRISPDNMRSIYVFEKIGAIFTGKECYIKNLKKYFSDVDLSGLDVLAYRLELPVRRL